jgi:tetratricopeptide (TPR) repeat protein
MGLDWENKNYRNYRRRLRLALVLLLLAAVAASAFWLLHRDAAGDVEAPAVKKSPSGSGSVSQSIPLETPKPTAEIPGDIAPELPVSKDDSSPELSAARQTAEELFSAGKFQAALEAYKRLTLTDPFSRGRTGLCLAQLGRWSEAVSELQAAVNAQPDDFVARKCLAQALYRQNELELALEQVQAALALQADDFLLELQAKLQKEIRVQRNYDDARTANFVVLFDGYEHEEMKYIVLDILKSAYADIGKELDYFPKQPISVILYTAKDFSDVTSAPMWVGGMFGKLDGKIRVPVQGAAGNERTLHRVLYHEYTHALIYALAPDCPLWLQEGLAQYFCGDEPVNISQVIPLRLLVNGFPNEPRAAFAAYMESLQVVYDLVEEHGMSRLRGLLDKLSGGNDLEKAFAASYGRPFNRWAKQWRPLKGEE